MDIKKIIEVAEYLGWDASECMDSIPIWHGLELVTDDELGDEFEIHVYSDTTNSLIGGLRIWAEQFESRAKLVNKLADKLDAIYAQEDE